jgi:hypothetical protein
MKANKQIYAMPIAQPKRALSSFKFDKKSRIPKRLKKVRRSRQVHITSTLGDPKIAWTAQMIASPPRVTPPVCHRCSGGER